MCGLCNLYFYDVLTHLFPLETNGPRVHSIDKENDKYCF